MELADDGNELMSCQVSQHELFGQQCFCKTCEQWWKDSDKYCLPAVEDMKWVKFTEDKVNGDRGRNRPSGYECYRCFDVRRRNLKCVSQQKGD